MLLDYHTLIILLLACSCPTIRALSSIDSVFEYKFKYYNKLEKPQTIKYLKDNGLISKSRLFNDLVLNETVIPDIEAVIYTVGPLDIERSSLEISLFFNIRWIDPRLKFEDELSEKYVDLTRMEEKIWKPDLFIENEIEGKQFSTNMPNSNLLLRRDGLVKYQVGYKLDVYCRLDLYKYPFDVQICPLTIKSFGEDEDSVDFRWRRFQVYDPILPKIFNKDFSPTAVKVLKQDNGNSALRIRHVAYYCNTSSIYFDAITCLQLTFVIRRKLKYYVTYGYAPAIFIVSLSSMQFYINFKAIPARVAIISICCVSLITHAASLSKTLDGVYYLKVYDNFMLVSLVFIIFAAHVYALLHVHVKALSKSLKAKNAGLITDQYTYFVKLDFLITVLGKRQRLLMNPYYMEWDERGNKIPPQRMKMLKRYNQIKVDEAFVENSTNKVFYFNNLLRLRMIHPKVVDRVTSFFYFPLFLAYTIAHFMVYFNEREAFWAKDVVAIQDHLKEDIV